MCNFNCKIRLQTFQMFLTKLKQKYKKIELLKNFCKNQIGFLQSLKKKKNGNYSSIMFKSIVSKDFIVSISICPGAVTSVPAANVIGELNFEAITLV